MAQSRFIEEKKSMFKKLSVVMCGVGVVLLSAGPAAAQTATQDAKQKTQSAATKTASVLTDAEITTAVKTKLLADKTVGGLKLDVDTTDGVVTLTGAASSTAERAQALRLARNTNGVKRVTDKLTIGTAEPTSGRVDAKPDEKTTVVIKDDTTPMVKKGVDKTEDAAKKVAKSTKDAAKKTADKIKDTDVKVKDDTKVAIHKDDGDPTVRTAGEATADAAITTAVKTKFLADSRVSGMKIDVDTSKGVVTLTGNVSSLAEKNAALDLARTTKGVKHVVDKLTVK
jgi:osmotically-inducible protein OsmY